MGQLGGGRWWAADAARMLLNTLHQDMLPGWEVEHLGCPVNLRTAMLTATWLAGWLQVEAVLYSQPAVHQAAVFGIPNRVMGELVGAAVVLRPGEGTTPPTGRDLVAWCATRLAQYKVPAAVHVLDTMPTTGSGKILKTELRRMFGGGGGSAPGGRGGDAPAAAPAAVAAAGMQASPGSRQEAGSVQQPGSCPAASQQAELRAADAGARLSAALGLPCEVVDAGLGETWGRQLLPGLTYVAVASRAVDVAHLVSAGLQVLKQGERHSLALRRAVGNAPQLGTVGQWRMR